MLAGARIVEEHTSSRTKFVNVFLFFLKPKPPGYWGSCWNGREAVTLAATVRDRKVVLRSRNSVRDEKGLASSVVGTLSVEKECGRNSSFAARWP